MSLDLERINEIKTNKQYDIYKPLILTIQPNQEHTNPNQKACVNRTIQTDSEHPPKFHTEQDVTQNTKLDISLAKQDMNIGYNWMCIKQRGTRKSGQRKHHLQTPALKSCY